MPKQLKVSLDFTANTDQAKRQIQDLSKALQQITLKTPSVIDDQQLKKAASAANELQRYLAAAVNVDTGKINLSEFSRQLNKGNTDLKKIHDQLTAIGPEGISAFNKLSQSLLQAETHTSKLKTMMSGFLTTLKNTARWQISSSILHGLQGAVQSAFYYAKDLDESLNNIRIVTGQNADQMAKFAKEANAAAQALSTTTTAYTNASLIYYQQGLNDKEVKERTDVTVKMANVTGESAQTISEQMTAVWNNFYDGSQSLESFSDKMVALGAATASSSSEISAGLNQFAATANTVGLSFDYAAAALATVTATTRQSANVVGNSFKTLFARLEGLSLGETLEDGTNLNKYSAALEKVGISIKDQNGELKAMDTILDELGLRWQTLAKDQQVALAQTVGGVRQYTQLIALMDNWDFMQTNLQTVRGSEGALQEQQEIYEEGWRAAADRTKAALESIYDTLIDDKKLKKLYDFGTTALNSINGIIKGLGGVRGIFNQIMSWILQLQAKNVPNYINQIKDGLASVLGMGKTMQQKNVDDIEEIYAKQRSSINTEENPLMAIEIEQTHKLALARQELMAISKNMSDAERAQAEAAIQNLSEQYQGLVKEYTERKKIASLLTSQDVYDRLYASANRTSLTKEKTSLSSEKAAELGVHAANYDSYIRQLQEIKQLKEETIKQADVWEKDKSSLEEVIPAAEQYIDLLEYSGEFNKGPQKSYFDSLKQSLLDLKTNKMDLETFQKVYKDFITNISTPVLNSSAKQITADIDGLEKAMIKLGVTPFDLSQLRKELGNDAEYAERLKQILEELANKKLPFSGEDSSKFSAQASRMTSSLMAFSSMASSAIGMVNTLSDSTASFSTKMSAGITGILSFATGIGRVIKMMEDMSKGMQIATGVIGGILLALQIGISIWQQYDEAQKQAHNDQAAKDQEKLQALQEENAELEKLANTYDDLLKKYNETGEGEQDLISSAQELIDKYEVENGHLLLLAGDYDQLSEAIRNNQKAREGLAETVTGQAISSAEQVFLDSMREGLGHMYDGQTYKVNSFGSANSFNSYLSQAANKVNSNYVKSTDVGYNYQGVTYSQGKQYSLEANRENLVEAYEDVQKIVDEAYQLAYDAGKEAELQTDSQYQAMVQWLEKSKSSYEALKSLLDTQTGQEIAKMASQYEVENLTDFQQLQQDLSKNTEFTAEQINTFLQGSYSELYSLNKAIEEAGKASHMGSDYIQSLYDKYGDVVFKIDWTVVRNENDVKLYLDYLETIAENNPIKLKFDLATEAEAAYKEGMNAVQLQSFYNQYEQLFKDAGTTLSDFIYMSEDERKDWLANQITETKPQVIAALNEETEALIARRDAARESMENDTIAAARDQYNDIEQQLRELEDLGPSAMAGEEYNNLLAQRKALLDEYPEILNLTKGALDALDQKIQENQELSRNEMDLLASNAESFKQLDEWLQNGTIDTEAFNRGFEKLRDKLDDEIDTDEYENLVKFLKDSGKELKGVSKEFGVNERSVKRAAQAILRFDDAIQEVNENYDDWMKALTNGTAQDAAKAAEELKDTYADLLDLPFGDTLGADFLQSAENLELMKQAAEGSEEAYRKLQNAARESIAPNIDTTQFDTAFNELLNEYYGFQNLDDMNMGARLDNADFLAALSEMVNAAGLTAKQATDYLAAMGVDAEVTEEPVEEEYTGYTTDQEIDTVPKKVRVVDQSTGTVDLKEADELHVRQVSKPYTEKHATGAFSLKVTAAGKSSGGGFKYNQSSHGGGGGGGSKGGGGGGGSKKTGQAEHAKKAPNDKAGDRYHVINNQIEDLAKQYDRLSEAEERAFGKSKLALMDQQKEKLEEQYKAQRELREEAERYWKEDLANLQNGSFDSDGDGKDDTFGASRYGMDVKLDENGTILNYDQLVEAADAYYNAKVDAYNAWLDENYIGKEVDDSIEEQKKQLDEEVKNEEQYRQNFLGLIDQYEETQDKVQEELNKEIEAYHAVLDKMLEKTDYKVELKLDVADDSLNLLNFLMNTLEDNAYRSAEAIDNLQQQFNPTLDKYEANKTGLRDLFNNHFDMDHVFDNANADVGNNEFIEKMKSLKTITINSADDIVKGLTEGNVELQKALGEMGDEFTEEEVGKFREYTKGMMDSVEDMLAIRQNMYKTLDDAIAQSNDDLDRLRDKIENASKVTEHWKNLIDLVGRDMAGMDTDTMVANEEKSLNVLQAKVAADKDMMDEAQAVLDGLMIQQDKYKEGSNEWNEWKKRVEEAEDRLTEMTENYYSSWEEALEAVRTKFEKTIQWMGEDYSKVLGGKAGNLEGLQNLMDQYQKTHDTYVPEFERVYQLNKLNAAAIKAIDETNNIKAKKQLQEYQQQILEAQESGREMSEYELQNLEKELALRQAALALEESRNVKSQVRMQRDNEGNYSYVYTADEDAVADAENNYRDKLYEMQKANYEYINELQNNIVSLQQDYQQAIANAAETYGYGTEAYYDAVDKINSYYDEALKAQYDELNLAMKNNQDLQEFDKNFHAQMTHDKSVSDEGYITSFDQTLYSQLTGYKTLEDATQGWSTASQGYVKGVKGAMDAYLKSLKATCTYAGTTLGGQAADGGVYPTFGAAAEKAFNDAKKAAIGEEGSEDKGLMGAIDKMAADAKEKLVGADNKGGLVGIVGQWVQDTVGIIDGKEGESKGLTGSLNNVIALLAGIQTGLDNLPATKKIKIEVEAPESVTIDVNFNRSPIDSTGDSGGSGSGDGDKGNTYNPTGSTTTTPSQGVPIEGSALQQLAGGDQQASNVEDYLETRRQKEEAAWKEQQKQKRIKELKQLARGGDLDAKRELREEYGITSWATGGYTGEWGNEGKLAILHEKELVLSKEDTANILAAVGMIRQISDVIDLNAKSSGGAFSSLFAANVRTGVQELQQDVHITAEFPNATDHNEILEAFDNVINLASQYANRKVQPAYTSF